MKLSEKWNEKKRLLKNKCDRDEHEIAFMNDYADSRNVRPLDITQSPNYYRQEYRSLDRYNYCPKCGDDLSETWREINKLIRDGS